MNAIDPIEIEVTSTQAGMVFHALAHPDSGVDIEHVSMILNENIDSEKFATAWECVSLKHDVLRSIVVLDTDSDLPRLKVISDSVTEITELDWSGKSEIEVSTARAQLMYENRLRGFDIQVAVPVRFHIVMLGENRTWILWSFHHIILDGRSFPLVLSTLFNEYDGIESHGISISKDMTFGEFAKISNGWDCTQSRDYWKQFLSPLESPYVFPLQHGKFETEKKYAPNMAVIEFEICASTTEELKAFAANSKVSLNALLQSAWALLLHHYSQQDAVVFGTTRAVRHAIDGSSNVVGLLINTVPFVVEIDTKQTVGSLIKYVYEQQLSVRGHELTPLTTVQEYGELGPGALFDSLLMYDDKSLDSRMVESGIKHKNRRKFYYEGQTNYSLNLIAYGETPLQMRVEYDYRKISDSVASNFSRQLVNILNGFLSSADNVAVEVPYLTQMELERLAGWNNSENAYNTNQTLHEIFEAQVERTPDAVAMWFNGQTMTYWEMNNRANALAYILRDLGVQPDDLVGIYAQRSFEMLIGIYAVIKAGGAYVPFDPEFPDDRLAFMVDDSGAKIIISPSNIAGAFPKTAAKVLTLSVEEPIDAVKPLPVTSNSTNLAYMLYTSGTTGKPKGVMIEHRSIVNRILWMQEAFGLDRTDTVLQKTPYSFDVSVWEFFWPLQVGARLAIANPGGHRDTKYLIKTIVEQQVTTLHFVPSMLQLFVEDIKLSECTSIKRLVCSGEVLPRDLQDRLFSVIKPELHNLYGPTEAAVDVTWWACDANSELKYVPIGKTIANTQIYILDRQLNHLPVGVAGELAIGGIQVGRGYHNRPELDAERFVTDPFNKLYKLYKTGDLARFLPDGNIEYMGRIDFQVKIRGQRLELGEIEAVLSTHEGVREVVVTAVPARSGDLQLVAYIVAPSIDLTSLKDHAREFLADFMLPSEWVVMDRFPLNTSGKVDRKKLPEPVLEASAKEFVAARSKTQERVLALWRDILGREDIGVSDTFFDVGGNSLLMIRLANRMDEIFEKSISIQDLLRETTVAKQAKFVEQKNNSEDEALASASSMASKRKAARTRRSQRNQNR